MVKETKKAFVSVAQIVDAARESKQPIALKFSTGCGAHLDDCLVSVRYLRRRDSE